MDPIYKTKLKYYLSARIMLVLLAAVLIFLLHLQGVFGQQTEDTVITDNSTATYKTLKLTSDLCIKYLADCKDDVYVDGLFAGYYHTGYLIQAPDESNVVIDLEDPINTNLQDAYSAQKTQLQIAVMAFIGPIILVVIIFLLIMLADQKIWAEAKILKGFGGYK